MLIFDQLKKDDLRMRVVAGMILSGFALLLGGLWWVQIVSSRDYKESLETQSFRTVRIPAVRGKILDCNGAVLAENRPTYNLSLYLDEMRKPFEAAYTAKVARTRDELKRQLAQQEAKLGRSLSRQEKKAFTLSTAQKAMLRQDARYEVASNMTFQVSERLQLPFSLIRSNFDRHYESRLVLPLPLASNLDPTNVARFEEQSSALPGLDLEIQSLRFYPEGSLAAHVLGYLKRDDSSAEGEDAYFSHRLPDYRGLIGIEAGMDRELRGMAGTKSVQVNNVGYRTTENIWTPAEPGGNVVLTIDRRIQLAADNALRGVFGLSTTGAVVVMDVNTGDILAMASSPAFNPNSFIPKISLTNYDRISQLDGEKNRATRENYMPGSIFKTVVGLAALEAGWDPNREISVEPNPNEPGKGCYKLKGRNGQVVHIIRDTAPPGFYNFRRGVARSSNGYFDTVGLWVGADRIIKLGQHVHFGELVGLPLNQETKGKFPKLSDLGTRWSDGATANISIGQGPVSVTPVQIAVLTCALANGGKVLWPRLVDRIEPQEPAAGDQVMVMPHRPPRDELGVSARSMAILHEAMLADTEDLEGTGRHVRDPDPLTGLRICGKTGTAQVQDTNNKKIGQTTWFASFAPYPNPRWAVVVMVDDGKSGGDTCAPVAGKVYKALLERERAGAVARAQ
jgi:penicillin-binding protein 2